ncbi:MAG: Xaa-Pro dipeptidase [Pseudomonadota bacterium]
MSDANRLVERQNAEIQSAAEPRAGGFTAPTRVEELSVGDQTLWYTAYPAHLTTLRDSWERALTAAETRCAVIPAGRAPGYLFDDQAAPYRPNPHFARWLPGLHAEGSVLLIEPGKQPLLLFHQPSDFWHLPPSVPGWLEDQLTVKCYSSEAEVCEALAEHPATADAPVIIGPSQSAAWLPQAQLNPAELLATIDYERAWKTRFEQICLFRASQRAAAGHNAAEHAFYTLAGAERTELAVHQAYLAASAQTDSDLPYRSIVGFNEHAGVLHYQHYERRAPVACYSLLIDAGATYAGYAADVTRTYALERTGLYHELVCALEQAQLELITSIEDGQSYLHLHVQMHDMIARVLCDAELLRCTPEQAIERRLTEAFFPHGLGHLLGLQTHDVGGLLRAVDKTEQPPPERYPALRLTRPISPGQVFTIEPGIYFIDQLLEPLLAQPDGSVVDRNLLSELKAFGGIRIEDNVLVASHGALNLTRTAFQTPDARR